MLEFPLNTLVSFHYYKDYDISLLARGGLRLIGDSGAFSAMSNGSVIDLEQFAAWGHRWRDSLLWVASLDVIGDPRATWHNYRAMRDQYRLDVVPTVHYGTDPKELDRYANDGVDFVGLGGLVGQHDKKRVLRWAASMFRHARDNYPGMRFHGWGATRSYLSLNLPFYSVDSSSWTQSFRFGEVSLFVPQTGGWIDYKMNGKSSYEHGTFLRDVYGIDPDKVAVSNGTTKRDVVVMSARAWQLFERYLQRRHHVPAPSYGLREPSQLGRAFLPESSTDSQPGMTCHLATFAYQCEIFSDDISQGSAVHLVFGQGDRNVRSGLLMDDIAESVDGPGVHLVMSRGNKDRPEFLRSAIAKNQETKKG